MNRYDFEGLDFRKMAIFLIILIKHKLQNAIQMSYALNSLGHSTVHLIRKWVFEEWINSTHPNHGDRELRHQNDRGHLCSKLLKSFRITAVRRSLHRHHHLGQSHHHHHYHDCHQRDHQREVESFRSHHQTTIIIISLVEEMSKPG